MRTEPSRAPRLRAEPSNAPPPSGPGGGASDLRPRQGGALMPQRCHGPRLRGRPLLRVRTDAPTDMAQAVAQDDRASSGRLRQGGTSHDARGNHARRQRRRPALDAGCSAAEGAAAERSTRWRHMRAWRNSADAPASEAGGPRPMGVRLPPPVPLDRQASVAQPEEHRASNPGAEVRVLSEALATPVAERRGTRRNARGGGSNPPGVSVAQW